MGRWAALLAALTALGGSARAQDMDAQAILARVSETYRQVQDLSASGIAAIDLEAFGSRQQMTIRQSALFRRPNRLRLESTMAGGGGTRTVVCDGRHVYVRQDVTREYTRCPAPDTVCAIRELQTDAPNDLSQMVDIPALLDGVDLSERIEQASVERTGSYLGASVHVLSLTLKGGHTERLWVGQQDFLVWKLEFRLNPESAFGMALDGEGSPPEGPRAAEGEATEGSDPAQQLGEALLGTVMQAFKMEMTWTERYRDLRLNSGVPDESFRFQPRPGERRVDRLSDIPLAQPETVPTLELGPVDVTG